MQQSDVRSCDWSHLVLQHMTYDGRESWLRLPRGGDTIPPSPRQTHEQQHRSLLPNDLTSTPPSTFYMADHLTLPEMLTEPIYQSEKFRNGDFEIISSDNVRLCVPMYLFQFASCVLRSPLPRSPPGQCSVT